MADVGWITLTVGFHRTASMSGKGAPHSRQRSRFAGLDVPHDEQKTGFSIEPQ
jgi:hypothetical protein